MNDNVKSIAVTGASLVMVLSMIAVATATVPSTVSAEPSENEVTLGVNFRSVDYELDSFGRRLTLSLEYETGEGGTCSDINPQDVVLTLSLPSGVSMVSETDGRGQFDAATNTVTWDLGTLDRDEHCFGTIIDVTLDVGDFIEDGTMLETNAAISTSTEGDDLSDNEVARTFQGGMLPLEVFRDGVDVTAECRGDDTETDSIKDVGGRVSCSAVDTSSIDRTLEIPATARASVRGSRGDGKIDELKPNDPLIETGSDLILGVSARAEGGFGCNPGRGAPGWDCVEPSHPIGSTDRGLSARGMATARGEVDVVNPNPFSVPLRVTMDSVGHAGCSNAEAESLPFPGNGLAEGFQPGPNLLVECDPPDDLRDFGKVSIECDGIAGGCRLKGDDSDVVSSDLAVVPGEGTRSITASLEATTHGDSRFAFNKFALVTLIRSGYGDANAKSEVRVSLAEDSSLPASGSGTLRVSAESPVDLIVTDDAGRRVGVDSTEPPDLTDLIGEDDDLEVDFGVRTLAEIPGSHYAGPTSEPENITIDLVEPGEFDLTVLGTADGPFTITIESLTADGTVLDSRTITGNATDGMVLDEGIVLQEDGQLGGETDGDTNQPPVADAGGPYTVDEGDSVQLDGTGSADPDGDDLTFAWDLDGDGTTESSQPMPVFDASALDGPTTVDVSLTVCDPSEACETSTVTVSVENVAPVLDVALDDPVDEGSPLTLTATIADTGLADTHNLVIEWGDGETDAVTIDEDTAVGTITVEHTFLDDGDYNLTIQVTDDDGDTDDVEATATVQNVPPSVSADGDMVDEGQAATVSASFTDPGVLDTHIAEIDWGDGTTETVEVDQGAGNGSIVASHTYGDDGAYEVTILVSDDDGGTGEDTTVVDIANLPPAVIMDTSGAITLPSGEEAVLGAVDQPQSHSAEATDPGSDDLTFTWSFRTETTYFNDGVNPDSPLSPGGTFPFTVTDTATVTFDELGLHDVNATVTDDDGGKDEARLDSLVTGDADDARGLGFWRKQYSDQGHAHYDDAELKAFLDIANHASGVYSEETDASTFDTARDALSPRGPEMRDKAEAQALAAWMNFAAGGVGWNEQIDTDGDGEGDAAFHELMDEVEEILADSDANNDDLERVKDLAEAINDGDYQEAESEGTDSGKSNGRYNGEGQKGKPIAVYPLSR